MTVTAEQLRQQLNAAPRELADLQRTLDAARALVDEYVRGYAVTPDEEIPEPVLDDAYLASGQDLWNRRKAPYGIVNEQYTAGELGQAAAPIRLSRDPASAFRHLLSLWCVEVGFA